MKLLFLVCTLLISLSHAVLLAGTETPQVFEPQVAGTFYSSNEKVLESQISGFFKNVPNQETKGKPIALISPHAGYQYSGQVAAHGFQLIQNQGFTRVIILAPYHGKSGKRFRGVSILKAKHFKTPLGLIPVDQEVCIQLLHTPATFTYPSTKREYNLIGSYKGAYEGEHSLEMQLPFLQMSLGNFKLVPIIIGLLEGEDFDTIANILKPFMNNKTLVIASSDFTHFGQAFNYIPFKDNVKENIEKLDYGAFAKILIKDFEGLKNYRASTGFNACGIFPIALLLKILPEDTIGEVLNYDTSGRQTKNYIHSVSYASILFTKPSSPKNGQYSPPNKTGISLR
ncbi:MAG: AmmeMemoRadiSam system protein B [Candidatus Brocadiaceae bacterium]|nr:AmmeMemoRadiSam system protein B [Candidatus Brocadiaceae bacterium]